jgi:predicted site-specific integrase-resolvase
VDQPGYLPVKKAAEWAGVSCKTLQRWIGRGLPVYQAGAREKVLIRPADIDQFLTRQERSPVNLDAIVEEVLQGFR